MKTALKSSISIFLSRSSGQIGVSLLFVIAGYLRNDSIGQLNLFFSFFSIFSSIAGVSLVYLQNEASGDTTHGLLLRKGLPIALALGIVLAILSYLSAYQLFTDENLRLSLLITSLSLPILSLISFITYYLEGQGKPEIPSKVYLASNFIQPVLFFATISMGVNLLFAVSVVLFIIDMAILFYLLSSITEPISFNIRNISAKDIANLFHKGLSMSIGVAIQKYAFSMILMAISTLGVASGNMYTVTTGLVFILILPQIGISHTLSILYKPGKEKNKDAIDCGILSFIYTLAVILIIFFGLPKMLDIVYNFNLNEGDRWPATIAAILFYVSQALISLSLSMSRSLRVIKTPQALACTGLFSGLAMGKFLNSNVFEFINTVSICLIISSSLIFGIIFRRNQLAWH